jgi:hypothetical protein
MAARTAREANLSLLRAPMLAFCFALVCAPSLQGDVIDRLMALVDGKVLTLGDVRQERALRQFFGDDGPRDDAAMLEELIEDVLIRAQVEQFPGIQVTAEEVEVYRSQFGDAGDLSAELIDDAIRQRMKLALYVDLRFRQFVRVSEPEIEQYYRDVFVPEAQTRGVARMPSLDEVRGPIRTNVFEEKVDREIRSWVAALVRRSDIEVVQ